MKCETKSKSIHKSCISDLKCRVHREGWGTNEDNVKSNNESKSVTPAATLPHQFIQMIIIFS